MEFYYHPILGLQFTAGIKNTFLIDMDAVPEMSSAEIQKFLNVFVETGIMIADPNKPKKWVEANHAIITNAYLN